MDYESFDDDATNYDHNETWDRDSDSDIEKGASKSRGRRRNKKRRQRNDDDDDFPNMFVDLFRCINFKVAIFLFIFGVFIFSDLFVENVISRFSGSVEGDCPTTKGTVMQLTILTMAYLVIDLIVQGGLV